MDDEGETCLRVSNGASIEIPLNVMNQTKLSNSLAFELVFKIRNVQNYSTLINKCEDEKNATGLENSRDFNKQKNVDNVDNYVKYTKNPHYLMYISC